MKYVKSSVVLFLCLFLSACGMHEFKQGDPLLALEAAKEASKAECYKAQAANAPKATTEIGMVLLAQQKSYEAIIGAITGKSLDPCSGGTNLNDVLIADVKARNESLGKFTDGFWGATKTVGALYFGYKTIDSVMSAKTGTTESYTFTGDPNIKGSFNTGDTKLYEVTGNESSPFSSSESVETTTSTGNTN